MVLELVDLLRCVEDHEPTWLVATVDVRTDRRILTGSLGCPLCHRVYPIAGGVADFRDRAEGASASTAPAVSPRSSAPAAPDATSTMRLAAQLDVRDAATLVLLTGAYAGGGAALRDLAGARVLLVNPSPGADGDGALLIDHRVPLAEGSVNGVALDQAVAPGAVDGLVRALRPGGRLVAPVALAVPGGVSELARDHREWVAARLAAASPPVPLGRRAGGGAGRPGSR